MGQADAEADNRVDNTDNQHAADLRDAKIENTIDIFGRVLNSLDTDMAKLKVI
jgi:hypothetical protein